MSGRKVWPKKFAIFGFIDDLEGFLNHRVATRLDIEPRIIDFGVAGYFFFYTSWGDFAESEESIALTIGSVRSMQKSSLSTQELLGQKIIQPLCFDVDSLRGNALIACFSKVEPQFSVYQTFMALPQLYYTRLENGFFCTTELKCLLALLDQTQINEDAIPMYFLFRLVPGPLTYFRNIQRLFPGQMLTWKEDDLKISLVQELGLSDNDPTFDRFDDVSLNAFNTRMSEVMAIYLDQIKAAKGQFGNLLSGGVDSSVLQLLINEQLPESEPPKSFSFAVKAPSFEFEIDYARYASKLFQTRHTFIDILPRDYPDLLIRTIEILSQPNLYNESIPCNLALAEFLTLNMPEINYFFAGQAADALHGVSEARKIALFEAVKRVPASSLIFYLLAILSAPWSPKKSHGLREVSRMLAAADNPASLLSPINYVAIPTELNWTIRCFGEEAVQKALAYRRSLEMKYMNSSSVLEKAQTIDLLTAGYDPAVVVAQLFSVYQQELIQFYLDEDVIRIALAFNPKKRFLKGLTAKPLQKQLLARHTVPDLISKSKGGTAFNQDLYNWMKNGPLQEYVSAIERPGFINKTDFNQIINQPGPFLWNLLTFDLFQKRVLRK